MDTAVLLIVFNRIETTKAVLSVIKKAKPRRLYVAADGPRKNKSQDIIDCGQVRNFINSFVDWDCELVTDFRDTNLGCSRGPAEAISWFFSFEKKGIILEDDCLPHLDFFTYCDWALSEFESDMSVWHINGNNFSAPNSLYKGNNLAFISLAQVWGWATWADRWRSFQRNPFYVRRDAYQNYKKWNISLLQRRVKLFHIERVCWGLDAWDYQWQILILNLGKLCLSPSSNLVSNIGDGKNATHTKKDSRTQLPMESWSREPYKPLVKEFNSYLTSWYGSKMGLNRYHYACLSWGITLFWDTVNVVRRLFFSERMLPIVVASSGRSGSTVLTDAISKSYINNRLGLAPNALPGQLFFKMARGFVDRLSDIKNFKCPVQKTHALYDHKYKDDAKYIFVYGDPLESALSVESVTEKHGDLWLQLHLFHLESCGERDDLLTSDILNFQQQIETWMGGEDQNILCIHYDELWEMEDTISQFVGVEIKLPEKRKRKEKGNISYMDEQLFSGLRKYMDQMRTLSSRR